jgi:DNA helicase-2/ATP-dependent DNA helicase PcrA
VASALAQIQALMAGGAAGFDTIKIDLRTEFKEAIRLGQYADADAAFAELARKRSYAPPSLPKRVLSTIHKAKGLECDNVLLMACDSDQFKTTFYGRCKMYVALSRAKKSLALAIPDTNPTQLFKVS